MLASIVLMILSGQAVAQEVTCKVNAMTESKFCSSEMVRNGQNYYFFGTNDTGDAGMILFSFGGLMTSSRPDGVMIKLDGSKPFKVNAVAGSPDVNCRGGCRWTVSAFASPSDENVKSIAAASEMLVSFTQGPYVSEPVSVDPRKIAGWFNEWRSLTKTAPE
ncbi:MAG TPA: hypothetical protein VF471_06080 [Pseudoxanthomonas sp.]